MRVLLVLCTAGTLAGCAAAAPRGQGIAVPPGHLPPPGECRIWYPERPPGQQPPPGPCSALQYWVPHGAYLIRG